MSNEKLTFQKAVAAARETDDAAKGAMERVYGSEASVATDPILKLD